MSRNRIFAEIKSGLTPKLATVAFLDRECRLLSHVGRSTCIITWTCIIGRRPLLSIGTERRPRHPIRTQLRRAVKPPPAPAPIAPRRQRVAFTGNVGHRIEPVRAPWMAAAHARERKPAAAPGPVAGGRPPRGRWG